MPPLLRQLDAVTDNFTVPDGACRTWQALYAGTAKLAHDLMDHMHLEKKVLFPKSPAAWPRRYFDLSRDRASKRFYVRAEFGQASGLVGQPFATTDFNRALSATVHDHAKFAVTARARQMIEVDPALAKQFRHQS